MKNNCMDIKVPVWNHLTGPGRDPRSVRHHRFQRTVPVNFETVVFPEKHGQSRVGLSREASTFESREWRLHVSFISCKRRRVYHIFLYHFSSSSRNCLKVGSVGTFLLSFHRYEFICGLLEYSIYLNSRCRPVTLRMVPFSNLYSVTGDTGSVEFVMTIPLSKVIHTSQNYMLLYKIPSGRVSSYA